MKKIAIVSLLTLGVLSAFNLEIEQNRDVLQENIVLLNIKDLNSSYSYLWREGNRTLGDSNPLKTSFFNGEHNLTVEVTSTNGVEKSAKVFLQAWKYKTATIKWIPLDDSVMTVNEYSEIINYKDALKEESEFVTKKYDKQENLILKIVEKPMEKRKDRFKETLYIYHSDKRGNCIKEEKFEYITPYRVTFDTKNRIIDRDRAKDFNQSRRTHFVTHYKYDKEGNKVWKNLEAIREGKNIIHMVIHGARAISYIYNSNGDVVKEIACNGCRGTKGRTFSYRYHNTK